MKLLALILTLGTALYVYRRRPSRSEHDRVLRAVRECYRKGVLA